MRNRLGNAMRKRLGNAVVILQLPTALAPTLLRAILRSARKFDKLPAYRVLLSAPRDRDYDLCMGSWAPIEAAVGSPTAEAAAARVLDEAVRHVCSGSRLYPGVPPSHSPPTLLRAIKSAIRGALSDGNAAQHVDAGFALLRRLEAKIAMGDKILAPDEDRAVGCDGASSWYEENEAPRPRSRSHLNIPAPGDVLVSHPLLRRDVVLVLAADGPDGFAMGLVISACHSACSAHACDLCALMPFSSTRVRVCARRANAIAAGRVAFDLEPRLVGRPTHHGRPTQAEGRRYLRPGSPRGSNVAAVDHRAASADRRARNPASC